MSDITRITLRPAPGRQQRICVGDSVFEDATVTLSPTHLHVEFEADDLDNVTIDLGPWKTP